MRTEPDISPELKAAIDSYAPRLPLLDALAQRLEKHTRDTLDGVPRIDRISFRPKAPLSFGRKSIAKDRASGTKKYAQPLEDIEDQVAGRVLVFFRRDIDTVVERLRATFNRVEQTRKAPKEHDAFAYESEHLVFIIPPQVLPSDWSSLAAPPTTFEMQVRTLFMHAWAEPEHDISYKAKVPLTEDEKRKIAWAASNAWGGDAIFEQVLDSLAERTGAVPKANEK
jgi:ppGpp synthetase/RelA/SpoT-type nucleotidyltranferase